MQEESTEAGWEPDALRVMEALMKRFVSSAWLERHGWVGFSA
jgi:hypothetical protein